MSKYKEKQKSLVESCILFVVLIPIITEFSDMTSRSELKGVRYNDKTTYFCGDAIPIGIV